MRTYSELIMDATLYVDMETLKLNSARLKRFQLHNAIHREMVGNVYHLASLEPNHRNRWGY